MQRLSPLSVLGLALLGACAEYSASNMKAATDYSPGSPSTSTGTGTGGGSSTTAPPETEDDAFFRLPPAQTEQYVFIANPTRSTVTRVDVDALTVRTVDVGADPQIVATTRDGAKAVSFNRADDSISILDVDTLDEVRVGVRDNFNQLRLSPDSRFAVLWHDVASERPDDPPAEGLQSFNEASFVDLEDGTHWPMAVGFNPRDVVFTSDGATAAIVSDEYLAVVDLRAATIAPALVRLTDAIDPPKAEEVVLAPSGDWAFVRQFGTDEILVVELATQTVTPIATGTNPTDLDLSPDGTEVVVVARGSSEIHVIQAASPFAQPTVVDLPETELLGSVELDPTGQQGVLYTTAVPNARYATWDRTTNAVELHALVKPIAKLAITPTGDTLLVFHSLDDDPDGDPDSPFIGEWALSAISLRDFRANPLLLPAEPIDFANSTDGSYGTFIMQDEPWLETLNYTSLLHDEVALRSTPVYVGVLPDASPGDGLPPRAWVSQEHDLGRISFFDPDDGSVETITGFELNSEIED